MQTIILDNAPTGRRLIAFWVDVEFPTGEYQLVPVGEAADKDARIAELETKLAERDNQLTLARGDCEVYRRQLAERSPGVMPEVVRAFAAHVAGKIKGGGECGEDAQKLLLALYAYFAPPDGHEWQPVDAEHPITAADVGRKVYRKSGGVDEISGVSGGCVYFYGSEICNYPSGGLYEYRATSFDITHILRPIAPPFVFAGEPGIYRTDSGKRCDVFAVKGGKLIALIGERLVRVGADGTFAGGRITGRVE